MIAGGAAGAFVSWLLQAWVRHRLDIARERQIAQFRKELDTAAAAAGFEYQRRLANFNLYVVKKHEALAELHRGLLDALSQIVRLVQGQKEVPAIEELNAEDAHAWMLEHGNIPAGLAGKIIAEWDTNRGGAVAMFEAHVEAMRPEFARRALTKANNYRLENELYLTPEIAKAASELVNHLTGLLAQPPGNPTGVRLTQNYNPLRAMEMLQDLRESMRRELGRNDAVEPRSATRELGR